jgi:hypothetical protein
VTKITDSETARAAALQIHESVAQAKKDGGRAKARIDDNGLLYFSNKAPGLKSALVGRSEKLEKVREHLYSLGRNFPSNPAGDSSGRQLARARILQHRAFCLSQQVYEAKLCRDGDIHAADFEELDRAIVDALDVGGQAHGD